MKILNSKKGYMQSWSSFMKGLGLGLIIGAIVVFLMYKGIIPIALP